MEKQKNRDLESDTEKFKKYIASVQAKERKYNEMNSIIKEKVDQLQEQLEITQNETAKIEKMWAARNITLEMVKEANTELERSENEITLITEKLYEAEKERSMVENEVNRITNVVRCI